MIFLAADQTVLKDESIYPLVRRLDEQILECVKNEALSASQQGKLLSWTHAHLVSAYAAIQLDAHPGPDCQSTPKRFLHPCTSTVDIIREMLQGGIPLENDLTFHCPPLGCPRGLALGRKLPAWLRRRITLAAQRTRLHTTAEIGAIWRSVEAHLITGAIVWFDLADLLDVDVPAAEGLHAVTRGCLEAVRGARGITWTPAGADLRAGD